MMGSMPSTCRSTAAADRFAEAHRIVRWHYQYMVLTDFLRHTVGDQTRDAVLQPVNADEQAQLGAGRWRTSLVFYRPHDGDAFMPVEFSGAAYRFGHSQIRPCYRLNTVVRDVAIFTSDPTEENRLQHLGGHRQFPSFWQIEWPRFFPIDGKPPARLQNSRRIDTHLAAALGELPPDIATGVRALAKRNLLRGRALGLPSGQSVARRMGATVLSPAELDLPGGVTPLWPYILGESQRLGDGGQCLGPVGGRLVAEVLVGLVASDAQSFLRVEPRWAPFLGPRPDTFDMPDLLSYADFGLADVTLPT